MKQSAPLSNEKDKALLTLKKASGTLQKVCQMVEEDRYCPDIIQQLDAVEGLLSSTRKTLLRGHLRHCLAERVQKDETKTVAELEKIMKLS